MATAGNGAGPHGGNGTGAPRARAEDLRDQRHAHAAHKEALDAMRAEGEAMQARIDHAHEMPPPSNREAELKLLDAGRAVLDALQGSASSGAATVDAFRTLVQADVALARASAVSATMLGMGAALAGVTTWLLLVTLLVVGLLNAGLPLWGALALAALATLLVAAVCMGVAKRRIGLANFAATRRQWQLLRKPHAVDPNPNGGAA